MQFCDQCGSPLNAGARFCSTCGAPLREIVAPVPAPEGSVPPPAATSASAGALAAPVPIPAPAGAYAAPVPVIAPVNPPAGGGVGPLAGPNVPPAPLVGSPQPVSEAQRRTNGGLVAALVGGGFVVGSALIMAIRAVIESFGYYEVYRIALLRMLLGWLDVVLPWATAGGAAAFYLRPPKNRILTAAGILGGPTLLVVIIAVAGADFDGIDFLLGHWYGDFILTSPLGAVTALAGWLVLRGRSGPRLLVVLLPLLVWFLLYSIYGGAVFAIPLFLAPVVGGAWLATIGTGAAAVAPARPAASAVPGPAFQVLYTDQGERVLIPTVGAGTPARTNGSAIASLVLALTGGLLLAGLPAIITGHVARRQIRERGESGDGMAIAGLVIGYLTLAIDLLVLVMVAANS